MGCHVLRAEVVCFAYVTGKYLKDLSMRDRTRLRDRSLLFDNEAKDEGSLSAGLVCSNPYEFI